MRFEGVSVGLMYMVSGSLLRSYLEGFWNIIRRIGPGELVPLRCLCLWRKLFLSNEEPLVMEISFTKRF